MASTLDAITPLTGASLIAGVETTGNGYFSAINPSNGVALGPDFYEADQAIVAQACQAAAGAQLAYSRTTGAQRAELLASMARQLDAKQSTIVARAQLETGLPEARLVGEMGRTCGQLRLFAQYLRDGGGDELVIDPAQPQRTPLPRPDVRQRRIAIGPVAVFGASNFPLAFSVAGGDTASALAAGCPVVIKGHPAHPGTSEIVARAIGAAVAECKLPAGVFSLIQSSRAELAQYLVCQPQVKAVAFTGSLSVGRTLMDIAAARSDPIPVFAEMGSINPMFLLPSALNSRGDAIAAGFVQALTLGEGQFCTNPGLVVAISHAALDRFIHTAAAQLQQYQPSAMLTATICGAYQRKLAEQATTTGVAILSQGAKPQQTGQGQAALLGVDAAHFLRTPTLQHEIFGPASLVIRCDSQSQMIAVANVLQGQLSATMHADDDDRAFVQELLPILERKAGRIVFNGFPTGVEVCHAIVHGGPWPATSDGRSTSVGIRAMERFLRLVCYQNMPQEWLAEYRLDD